MVSRRCATRRARLLAEPGTQVRTGTPATRSSATTAITPTVCTSVGICGSSKPSSKSSPDGGRVRRSPRHSVKRSFPRSQIASSRHSARVVRRTAASSGLEFAVKFSGSHAGRARSSRSRRSGCTARRLPQRSGARERARARSRRHRADDLDVPPRAGAAARLLQRRRLGRRDRRAVGRDRPRRGRRRGPDDRHDLRGVALHDAARGRQLADSAAPDHRGRAARGAGCAAAVRDDARRGQHRDRRWGRPLVDRCRRRPDDLRPRCGRRSRLRYGARVRRRAPRSKRSMSRRSRASWISRPTGGSASSPCCSREARATTRRAGGTTCRISRRSSARSLGHEAIAVWDLKNAPDLDGEASGGSINVDAWLTRVASVVRRLDPDTPVTVGWSSQAHAARIVNWVDVVSFQHVGEPGLLPGAIDEVEAAAGGRPIVLAGFGTPEYRGRSPGAGAVGPGAGLRPRCSPPSTPRNSRVLRSGRCETPSLRCRPGRPPARRRRRSDCCASTDPSVPPPRCCETGRRPSRSRVGPNSCAVSRSCCSEVSY